MRKLPAIAMIVLTALAVGSASPLMLQAQVRAGAGAPGAAGTVDDVPHRMAREFAPFVRAVILRRLTAAQQVFKLHRNVMNTVASPETAQVLNRFNKPDRLDLNLVGGKILGQRIGILFFTIAHLDGPVAFKIYYYGYNGDTYISRIEITDDWDDIETMSQTLEILANPVAVPLGQLDINAGL